MSPMYTPVNQVLPTNSTIVGDSFSCKTMPSLICSIIAIFSGFVGLPANVWLLWMLIQRQRSGVTDIYMLSLTIMNLIINVITAPITLNSLLNDFNATYDMTSFFYHCCGNGQPLFMVCICVDCYMAVVHPIAYVKLKQDARYRQVTCGLVWGLSVASGVFLTFKKEVAISSLRGVPYLLTLPTIVFCDLSILHALRKPDPSGRSDVHPQKRRALQIITNSFIVTVVAFLPPLTVFLFLTPLPLSPELKQCYVIHFTALAPLLGSTIMSLLNVGVKKVMKMLLCVLKPFK